MIGNRKSEETELLTVLETLMYTFAIPKQLILQVAPNRFPHDESRLEVSSKKTIELPLFLHHL